MKTIPFDIKYRPQIESGEYKVITDKGNEVRILDWNLNRCGRNDIVCAVKAESSDNENVQIYYEDGKMVSNGISKLKIETDEPELTDFEAAVWDLLNRHDVYVEDDNVIRKDAERLLKIANDVLCDSPQSEIDDFARGWNARQEREPKWRKSEVVASLTSNRFQVLHKEDSECYYHNFNDVLYDKVRGKEININELVSFLPSEY